MLRQLVKAATLCIGLGVVSFGAQASTLYGMNSAGEFITVDPATAGTVLIGSSSSVAVGLTYNPNTDTYYTRDSTSLYTINPNTGALTLVGSSGSFNTGLTFNAAFTTLYTIDQGNGAFYAVDPATGAATFIGNTGISIPLDLSTDAGGTVYVADLFGGIHTINTLTGASTFVRNVGFGLTAIDFDPLGSLYGISLDGDILYRDLLGTVIAVGPLLPNYFDVRGLEFVAARTEVPEPATLALLGIGLLGLAAARRNRRTA